MSRPRCLVVCSIGPNAIVDYWHTPLMDLDYALIDYSDQERDDVSGVQYFLRHKGYKISNFVALTQHYPEVLAYDYYVFLDDDLEITSETIDQLFRLTAQEGLDLAQPCLTPDSATNFDFLKHRPGVYSERVSFVEIQCFCISRRLLAAVWPYWHMAKSGALLDIVQSKMSLERFGKRSLALWHCLQFRHPNRPESQKIRGDETFESALLRLSGQFGFALTGDVNHNVLNDIHFEVFQQVREQPLTCCQRLGRVKQVLRRIRDKLLNEFSVGRRFTSARSFLGRVKRALTSYWYGLRGSAYPEFGFSPKEAALLFSAIKPEHRVLEYGSGKSTLDMARCAGDVTSIEHHPEWYDRVSSELPSNAQLVLAPSRGDHHSIWLEGGNNWSELDFHDAMRKDGPLEMFLDYIQAPTQVNPANNPYDVILIDGRARVFCAEYIYRHNLLAENGLLFVHDYERPLYHAIEVWFERIEVIDRLGVFQKRR